ncbi:MAG: hypothetical protein HY326_09020, partial [Chloroflexi bacterium]|nr:hypothetical protein [Chloroflexota bacterium]
MRFWWLILLGLALVLWAGVAVPARAQGPAGPIRVGLVVKHSDGRVVTSCVSLAKTNPTGLDVLRASGLDANIDYSSGIGAGVCALDGQGCITPGQQCFCQCQGASCAFWNYSYLTNPGNGSAAQWTASLMGALGRQVAAGDVEGWTWGDKFPTGDGSAGPYTFAEVCAAPAPAPSPTLPPPPATPVPTLTEKSVPLQTPAPSPTLPAAPATPIPTTTEKSVQLQTPAPSPTPPPPLGTTIPTSTEKSVRLLPSSA